jgi:dephospho-CoA kinase
VILVGLTGGIGSGKSTVSARLAELGATVVDADAIVREVQQPGTEVFAAIVEHFGDRVVGADGQLDRQAVADIVFNDPDELKALNKIVHPAVGVEIAERLRAAAETDDVVVLDVPLLVESGRDDMVAMLVVDLHPDVAVDRLVEHRGFDEDDARARIARQVSREERLAKATKVLDNHGSVDDLRAKVDELWPWLQSLEPVTAPKDQSSKAPSRSE